MKYLFTILLIICCLTLTTLFVIWPKKTEPIAEIAVTVNGHDLSKKSVAATGARTGYHQDEYSQLLDSVITRELLIQEAQNQKIDREQEFLTSLKSFYEESLIKTLMDRQYTVIEVHVEESEIEAYLSYYGKMIKFTQIPVTSGNSKGSSKVEEAVTEILFEDLAEPMKLLLSRLSPGESAQKFDTGSDQISIRLDSISPGPGGQVITPEPEYVKQLMEDYKRQQQIADWLVELRNKASITIHND